jgi:cation transporter-like permease
MQLSYQSTMQLLRKPNPHLPSMLMGGLRMKPIIIALSFIVAYGIAAACNTSLNPCNWHLFWLLGWGVWNLFAVVFWVIVIWMSRFEID